MTAIIDRLRDRSDTIRQMLDDYSLEQIGNHIEVLLEIAYCVGKIDALRDASLSMERAAERVENGQ